MQFRTQLFLIIFICSICTARSFAQDVVVKDEMNEAPIEQREAILILSGLGTFMHNTKEQKNSFIHQGYDVFIPDYLSKKSIEEGVKKIQRFAVKYNLSKYQKVHVLAYIVGSWSFNSWFEQFPMGNIASVVYDRSPLQETVPAIISKENPLLSKMLFGNLTFDLASTPYHPLENEKIHFGILIECKATKFLWKRYNTFSKLSPRTFEPEQFGQRFNDYCYFFLNHDDMYTELHVAAPTILHFFRKGTFGEADRIPCNQDPFRIFRKSK